jgi:arginine decarboxylase
VAGGRRDADEHAQDRRLAHAERDAPRRRQRPRRRGRGGPRHPPAALDEPFLAPDPLARGLGESVAAPLRLAGDVEEVVERIAEPGATAPIMPPAASLHNEMAVSPRDAFLGPAKQVPVAAAVGRISCESIASYPPGVLPPGERVSAETVDYLRALATAGARLHGASDAKFETINVLRGSS